MASGDDNLTEDADFLPVTPHSASRNGQDINASQNNSVMKFNASQNDREIKNISQNNHVTESQNDNKQSTGIFDMTIPSEGDSNRCTTLKIVSLKVISVETRQQIFDEYKDGADLDFLAKKYDTSKGVVYSLIYNFTGIKLPEYPLKLRPRNSHNVTPKPTLRSKGTKKISFTELFLREGNVSDLDFEIKMELEDFYEDINDKLDENDILRSSTDEIDIAMNKMSSVPSQESVKREKIQSKDKSIKDISIDMKQKIYKEFNEGVSKEDIARKYDISVNTVQYIGQKCLSFIKMDTRLRIYFEYKAGVTLEELAEKYELNCDTVKFAIYKLSPKGTKYNMIGLFPKKRKDILTTSAKIEICEEYYAGTSVTKLMEKYNLERRVIQDILKIKWTEDINIKQDMKAEQRSGSPNKLRPREESINTFPTAAKRGRVSKTKTYNFMKQRIQNPKNKNKVWPVQVDPKDKKTKLLLNNNLVKLGTNKGKKYLTRHIKDTICQEFQAGAPVETLIKKYDLTPHAIKQIIMTLPQNQAVSFTKKYQRYEYNMLLEQNEQSKHEDLVDAEIKPERDSYFSIVKIKKELEELDEVDEFEKLLDQNEMLKKTGDEIELTEMSSVPVKMEQESDDDTV